MIAVAAGVSSKSIGTATGMVLQFTNLDIHGAMTSYKENGQLITLMALRSDHAICWGLLESQELSVNRANMFVQRGRDEM